MALRLNERRSSPASMGVGANIRSRYTGGIGAVGAFEDDQTPFIEETDLARVYNGPAGLSEIEFFAIPGLKGTIANAVSGASKFKNDILRIEVWQDTSPGGFVGLLFDKYRVRVWTRGDIEPGQGEASGGEILDAARTGGVGSTGVGVLPILAGVTAVFLIKLILILGVAIIVGVLVWKATRVSWGDVAEGIASRPLVLLGVIGIGVGLFLATRRR